MYLNNWIYEFFFCTQVWPLPCLVTKSLIDSSFLIQYIDFSMFVDRFVIIVLWISLSCYLDLSKLPHGFIKITWVCQSCSNKTKLKFDQDFIVCWSFCFELKLLNESKYSVPWVRCGFGNVCCICGGQLETLEIQVLNFGPFPSHFVTLSGIFRFLTAISFLWWLL